eukprot:CAMPEP_0196581122 /NCGR_PEP_ID=MMETSP1081-20130531/32512_1 /TAXON_ID=36882 /ORGANISM="Pyramimonas amylifera, Strain CCMP720" /LENGTH=54 /DNA_ID=CAMNT_0041901231 /DNA_START=418 /DNA_END=582 /DNA_ORIENTATION=+
MHDVMQKIELLPTYAARAESMAKEMKALKARATKAKQRAIALQVQANQGAETQS